MLWRRLRFDLLKIDTKTQGKMTISLFNFDVPKDIILTGPSRFPILLPRERIQEIEFRDLHLFPFNNYYWVGDNRGENI